MQAQIPHLQLHVEVQPANQPAAGSRATDAKHPRTEENILKRKETSKSRVCHQRKRESSRSLKGSSKQAQEQRKSAAVIAEARALKTKMRQQCQLSCLFLSFRFGIAASHFCFQRPCFNDDRQRLFLLFLCLTASSDWRELSRFR